MPYPNYYQQFTQPNQPFNAYQPPAQKQEVTRVNGRNGAEAYQLAPNSSILMLDETAPIVWLKQSDGAGYASLTPYSITPYQPEAPVDVHSLEERVAKLEEALNEQSDIIKAGAGDATEPRQN